METRSSSRLVSNPSSNPTPSTNPNLKGRNRRRSKQRIKYFNLEELSPPIVTMADQLTMAQLLKEHIEGYEDVIVVPAITADNFKLKLGLFTLVQKNNPSSNPNPSTTPNPKGRNRRCSKQRIEDFNLEELSPLLVTMANQRTMAQLLQAPTEGYKDVIVVPAITADNFELKHGLLTLV
nr:reverse transcriptase domain-containing protein [Tanacetum cinerariifolium]